MGIDRNLMDSGLVNMSDYAEDFLSRLGREDHGYATGSPQYVLSELFKQFGQEAAQQEQQQAKDFELNVVVKGYKPSDLRIRVENGMVIVSGKRENKSDDGMSWETREFERKVKLPADVILEEMKSSLRHGFLIITAPVKTKPAVTNERVIPIQIAHEEPKAVEVEATGSAPAPTDQVATEKASVDDKPVLEDVPMD